MHHSVSMTKISSVSHETSSQLVETVSKEMVSVLFHSLDSESSIERVDTAGVRHGVRIGECSRRVDREQEDAPISD